MKHTFVEKKPTSESCWRAAVLMGRNVATYKFALAKSLIELANRKENFIRMEELAEPFSRNLCEHLQHSDKQITSRSSGFLDACRSFNQNEISKDELIGKTVSLGFNNVIDAFHVVREKDVPVRFFEDDRSARKGIQLTDSFFAMAEGVQFANLSREAESRWRLVETAWKIGISPHLIDIAYDGEKELLYVPRHILQRGGDITSARDALNGYQKGRCFYCYRPISIQPKDDGLAHVDHVIAHYFKRHGFENLDGIWNLVLACQKCNNGEDGKFEKIPALKYMERLDARNNYLVQSHHPLRETLIRQTGNNDLERGKFLNRIWNKANNLFPVHWEPEEELEFTF